MGNNRAMPIDNNSNPFFTLSNPGYVNTAAGGNAQVVNPDGSTNVVVTGSNLTDASAIPIKQAQRLITLANAVTITDTALKTYDLITQGAMTEAQIRQFRKFKVSFVNTHDQAATIMLWTVDRSLGATGTSGAALLYTEATVLTATTGRLILQDLAGGTGVATQIKPIPALGSIHSNLIVGVQFAVAPTSGSLTVMVEAN